MRQSAATKFGIIAIISAVIIILLIVALALFALLVRPAESETVEDFENPTFVLNPDEIDPALAISLLGGISTKDMVDQALSKARPGAALATIISSPELKAKDVAGDLLLLAKAFEQQNNLAKARLSYYMAGTLATLSPDLSDTIRADIFLQAGEGLSEIGDPILAKIYLDQAFLVATESNMLQPAYRQTVLARLHSAYLDISLNEQARKSLELSVVPPALESAPENPLVLPISREIPLPQEVQTAEADRWLAAQAVVKDLVELGGEVQPEKLLALRQALLKEDALKTEFFDQALQTEAQVSGKVNIMQAKINWQSLKYRLARRGFGLEIVPEWEGQAEQIRSELTASYEELYRLYNDLIVAMPDASQIDRAAEEALRRQILAGQLGQYPNYPAEQLQAQLLNATARLAETQPNTKLRVSYLLVEDVPYYVLISDKTILENNNQTEP